MKQRIIEIITELRDVIKVEELNINDDTLFSEAVSCWRGEQVGKCKNQQFKPTFQPTTRPSFVPATEKQKNYIYKLDANANTENLSKQEAARIIQEALDEKRGKTVSKNNP